MNPRKRNPTRRSIAAMAGAQAPVEVEPVVVLGGAMAVAVELATPLVAAVAVAQAVSAARKPVASGAWMLAIALPTSAIGWRPRNRIAAGWGITIPMWAAMLSI